MFFPIKIRINKNTFFKIDINIPFFLSFKEGIRFKHSISSEAFLGLIGEKKDCLHVHHYKLSFRIRSNKCLKGLKPEADRFTYWTGYCCTQIFNRGII